MEKEKETTITKFKLKFPKFFSSSCITHDISKAIHHPKPIFTSKSPLMEESKEEVEEEEEEEEEEVRSKYQTPLFTCKPRCPESFDQMVRESCLIPTAGNPFPRRKLAGRYSLLSPAGEFSGRRCPPVSPASPLFQTERKKKKKKKKTKKSSRNGGFSNKLEKPHFKNQKPISLSSSNDTDWFSSDDEREEEQQQTETLFPLCSKSKPGRVGSKMEDTFAVVKNSSDPYNDFRTSMVEMVVEKQIFGERELEKLLQCFLSLNSPHHHRVIVEVFTEVWDALFSHSS